jgi:hypothetical protein
MPDRNGGSPAENIQTSSEEETNRQNIEQQPSSTEQTPVPEPATTWWLVTVIAICALIAVAVTLALVYLYYYHAGVAVKRWLGSERFQKPTQQPIPPPRVKKQQGSNISPDV